MAHKIDLFFPLTSTLFILPFNDKSSSKYRNLGGKKVPLNYRLKKENVEADSLSSLETVHPVSSNEKRLPSNLTLKRKTLEVFVCLYCFYIPFDLNVHV